jgi:hypothetical protein
MTMHSRAQEIETVGQVQQHGVIRCVVVLEDRDAVRERLEDLLKDAYWVPIPEKDWRQCRVWAERLVRYFILDIVLFEELSAGFHALEEIKSIAPDAFCAIVTEDISRVHRVAQNLGADHICGKSDAELRDLLRRLDNVSVVLTERERALLAFNEVGQRSLAISSLLENDETVLAEHQLITLEPPLAAAFALTGLGDDFAMLIDALRFALVNQPGRQLSTKQWRLWLEVLDRAFTVHPMDCSTATDLADRLERAGWITEPPDFGLLASFLLDDGIGEKSD